jgi:transcription antitermination factor NusG
MGVIMKAKPSSIAPGSFTPGDWVEIVSGPLTKARGVVEAVNDDRQMLKIRVKAGLNIIGTSELPVELKFQEVKKVNP